MKYEELGYIFSGYKTTIEAKKDGSLPEVYHDSVPDYCVCGSETIISSNLTVVRCVDPRCEVKMAYSLLGILRGVGCKHVGIEACKKLINKYKDDFSYKTPLCVFYVDNGEIAQILDENAYLEFVDAKITLINKTMSLGDLASLVNVAGYDLNAQRIFKEFSTPGDVKTVVDNIGGVEEFLGKLFGIKDEKKIANFNILLQDVWALYNLKKDDTVLEKPDIEYKICVTGPACVSDIYTPTRNAYIDMLNAAGKSKNGNRVVGVILSKSFTLTCDYVVCDIRGSDTNKERLGERDGKLITSREMLELVKEEVRKREQ